MLHGVKQSFDVMLLLNTLTAHPHPVSSEAVVGIHESVLPSLYAHFDSPILSVKCQDTTAKYRRCDENLKITSTFISDCVNQGIHNKACAIFNKTIKILKDESARDFQPTILPFVRDVALAVEGVNFDEKVTKAWRGIFTSALKAYLIKFVCNEPGMPWKIREPITCGLQPPCASSISINEFLQSVKLALQGEDVLRVPLAEHKHILIHLQRLRLQDCIVGESSGTQVKYVTIRKTWKHFNKRHNAWQDRMEEAHRELLNFGEGTLRTIPGAAYDDIYNMRRVKLAPEGTLGRERPVQPPFTAVVGTSRDSVPNFVKAEDTSTSDTTTLTSEEQTQPGPAPSHHHGSDNRKLAGPSNPTEESCLAASPTSTLKQETPSSVTGQVSPIADAEERKKKAEDDRRYETTGCVRKREWKRSKKAAVSLDDALGKFM
jgi:hypothetical protein